MHLSLGDRQGAAVALLVMELKTYYNLQEVIGPPSALSDESLMEALERYDDVASHVVQRLSVDEVVCDTSYPAL